MTVFVVVVVIFIVLLFTNDCTTSLMGDTVQIIYFVMSAFQSIIIAACTCYLHKAQVVKRKRRLTMSKHYSPPRPKDSSNLFDSRMSNDMKLDSSRVDNTDTNEIES